MTQKDDQDRILIIEDDDIFCKTLVNTLKKAGYVAEGAESTDEAIELIKEKQFSVIVSDVRLSGGTDGIDTLLKIKETQNTPSKLILMTGFADKEAPIKAIKLGVVEYLFKPFEMDVFLNAVKKSMDEMTLEKSLDIEGELSNRDELTTLFNHRYFHEIIDRETKRTLRYNHPLSLIMIDIDDFSDLNEKYGYFSGDVILKRAAFVLLESVRSVDLVFRYGGKKFAVLLPETNKNDAKVLAERLCQKVSDAEFNIGLFGKIKITISTGLAEYFEDVKEGVSLIFCAEEALNNSIDKK